jgi:uracil-DNA glycosylase family 4
MPVTASGSEPHPDCPLCPRLHDFIAAWRQREPEWFNAPVPTFSARAGDGSVRLLIVGLAPGLRGANRTGRPFTGDFAGDLLYSTLSRFGFSRGEFKARPDDGVQLVETALTNAVRCVPPENKPVGAEIATCRRFLAATVARYPNLEAVVTLGTIAHQSTVRALGLRVADVPFSHGGRHETGKVTLFSSYHCSRYNTNTGRLTEEMFVSVFAAVREHLGD